MLTDATHLKVLQCGNCGVWHAIPQVMFDNCVEEGGFWHCPNGHSRGYKEGRHEREEVRRERDRLKQAIAQKNDEIATERKRAEQAEKTAASERSNVVKLRKRASSGVCPCCNRTVSQMAKHMATKHPGFKAEAVA